MPLGRKTIRENAQTFIHEWRGETRENAEAKPFWEAFFQIFGVHRRRIASFEEPVHKADEGVGFIDLLWKGKLLVEHKSKGKNLDKAYIQAVDYFPGLKDEELPRYVLVSDFDRFRLHDLDADIRHDFTLDDLADNIHLFDFIAGYEEVDGKITEVDLNLRAAEILGQLHDALKDSGYTGHELEVFLVRVLFCLFAEDTGIFNRHLFIRYLLDFTREDGSDTDMHLSKLFQVLDKPDTKRNRNLSDELNAFPYVNGHLFKERLDMPSFDTAMREQLIECAFFDWSSISPAIFGSLFQSVMDNEARRSLGAHYTSERNIQRLIGPLFLDRLWQQFTQLQKLKRNTEKQKRLIQFQQQLSTLNFLDPACGCGNFLVITYRELRRLELAILAEQQKDKASEHLDFDIEPLIQLDQFHGIEIDEWPVRIAEVAMWLTQHQMNRECAQKFGREPDLLPLRTAAHIVHGDALALDWQTVVAKDNLDYIIGNPPFRGSKYQSSEQKTGLRRVFGNIKNSKQLDFVACWFKLAADWIHNTEIRVAFVSTNSITQGEQVAPLWESILASGIHIHFAHQTFAWDSEARGKAAVHVVIIGYAATEPDNRLLFGYPDTKGEPEPRSVKSLNPYLVEAAEIVIGSRKKPLCNVPPLWFGNMPLDGGHLLLSADEKAQLVSDEPAAKPWLRPVLGAREYLNGIERWCLWLPGISPKQLRAMPKVMARVELVSEFRLASKAESTRVHADRASEFRDTRLPDTYVLVPKVSSERREYIPMGFFDANTISTDLNFMIPEASLYHFGILESRCHMAWMRTVAGRLKSDYRYSAKLVYNNFPWPETDKKQHQNVETAAQAVLDARANHPDSTPADLYDPLSMPADLRKAHKQLDRIVDRSYRSKAFKDDPERLKHLFEHYQTLVKKEKTT